MKTEFSLPARASANPVLAVIPRISTCFCYEARIKPG